MKLYLRSRQNELSAKATAGLNFSKRIASKYGIFRKTGRLSSLIFLRLSGVRAKNKNLDPVHRISINNYLKFQFSFYFEFIRQLIKTQENYRFQKLYNLINRRKEIFSGTSGRGIDFRKSLYYSLNVDRSGDSMVVRQPQKPLSFSGKDHPFRISKTHTRNFKFFSGHPEVFPQMLMIKPHEYVNKELYFENIGPEYKGNYKYLPTGIQPSYNEMHSSGSAPVAVMGRTSERTNEIRKNRTISNQRSENIPETIGNSGKNLLHIGSTMIRQAGMVLYSANAMSYPQRVFKVAYLGSKPQKIIHPLANEPEERLTSSTKIVNHIFIGTDSASTKSDTLSYPKNRVVTSTGYENILPESGKEGKLLFTGLHLITRPANITLIYSNPEVVSYFERTLNVENAGPKHGIIQTLVQGARHSNKEKEPLEPALLRMSGHPALKNAFLRGNTETEINYKNLPEEDRKTGKNPPTSHLISKVEKTFVNPETTGNISYSRRMRNSWNNKEKQDLEQDLIRMSGHPAVKNAFRRRMTETEISYKNLPENRKKGKNPPGSHLISRPLKISFNAKNIISKSNRGIHHFVSTNTSYENIIKEYEKTGRKNTINQHRGGKILKSTSEKFSELFFPETSDISHNSSTELILKKPAVQKTEIISENKAQTEKTSSRNINDTLIRESFKEKSQYEINRIADTVYKIIEKRITIEKDRRGLF